MADTYRINEIFYSVQGEGVRAGTPMVFVRFSRCNMQCTVEPGPRSPGGFDCDTEFESGRRMDLVEIHAQILEESGRRADDDTDEHGTWLLLTGGEPALQVDLAFCEHFKQAGYRVAIETNGSMMLPTAGELEDASILDRLALDSILDHYFPFDHITVSPKVAEHAIRQKWAHEVRYVRGTGQAIPDTKVRALRRLISPASDGDQLDRRAIAWCQRLVLDNPEWGISVQMHKAWMVR